MKTYLTNPKCAIYIRISRDEIEEKRDSIAHQKKIISKYCLENNLTIIDYYIDSGISGTTFNRPNLIRLLNDLKHKLVNTIIVKDLSRLGRNHLKVGKLIEEEILNKARLISVNEAIDTALGFDETIPFRNLVNEYYSKDLSRKVKSSISYASKRRRISSIQGGFYGYQPGINKHSLEIDEKAARVIKKIFELHLNGLRTRDIAKTLSELSIETPGYHRYLKYNDKSGYNQKRGNKYNWTSEMIRRILNNSDYTGSTTQLKTRIVRGKEISVPNELRVKLDNTHKAIISKEVFFEAQKLLIHTEKKKPTNITKSSLSPLVINETNHKMSYVKKRNGEYEYRSRSGARYGIDAKVLHEIVKLEIKDIINIINSDQKSFENFLNYKNINPGFDELDKLKFEHHQLTKQGSDLFNQKLKKKIDSETYKNHMIRITIRQEELKLQMDNSMNSQVTKQDLLLSFKLFKDLFVNKEVSDLINFSKEIIDNIKVLKIEEEYKIRINYKFIIPLK